jgi:GMP synthase-like glutamine amidotransferase
MKPVAIFRHSPGEGPGYFATFLARHGLLSELIAVDAGASLPPDVREFAGLVFMGGPMSVNDPLPWITEECTLIRAAAAQGIPLLGHCLGGQLLAKALGGDVTRNPVKEIGWGRVNVLNNAEARAWFGDLPAFLSFHWHGETFNPPPGATRILESLYCENQAFVLGPHLAMQCHVEMTAAMIARWCLSGAKEIDDCTEPSVQRVADIEHDMEARLAALNAVADILYTRWVAGLLHD